MFADISGFTALSERLDPERVTEVMNACFERLESVVLAHGGIIDAYLGDCVKAVFGFSLNTSDPVSHAVQAAIELRETLAQYNREAELAAPLEMHIGINTGPVIALAVKDGATETFSILGDTVRLAAELENVSDRGEIYVGPETYRATADEFTYDPRPAVTLPPAETPFPVYALVAPKRARRRKRDSERRQATVVFAEVVGLEDLSRHCDADQLAAVMSDLFHTLAEAVTAFGGFVDKFLGEGIMALFGVPNAIEHAPRQAVNAAIEMRNRVRLFAGQQGLPVALELHAGVSTGLCIAGDLGGRVKRDFTVIGDTVNVAARLEEAAPAGTIYATAETHRLTADDFDFAATRPLELKGKARPLPVWEVRSQAPQRHRTSAVRSERMVFSEMVGREAELAECRTRLEQLAAGRGGVIDVVGEAGLGKSRLLAEVRRLAGERAVPVIVGRSLTVGPSFHPFMDLLRHWCGAGEDAGAEEAAAALEAALTELMPERRSEVFPFLARLAGLPVAPPYASRIAGIEGEALETLIFKSVRELLQALAARQPTALVFEDLQWADRSSIDLLESLLPLATELPLLFVHAFRPLFEESSERILRLARQELAGHHSELHLERLDDGQAAVLIGNLLELDAVPEAVRRQIGQKAEGNPFYIEEVVRSLIDAGAIVREDGRYRFTQALDSVVIPGTIQEVVMARVDRLGDSARQLLQIASVVGRQFYHRIVAAIVESEATLESDLALLEEKQIILESGRTGWEVPVGERDVGEELEYLFRHALAQEAVYESLLLRTRRELHEKVAATIERVFADRLVELAPSLAHHYTRAEKIEPAERHLFTAGESALQAAAFAEALGFFRQAAEFYARLHGDGGDARHRAALEKNVGLALLNTGHHSESISHFDRALELLGEPVARNPVSLAARWAVDMAAVLLRLYVYEGRRRGQADLHHERAVYGLYFERGHAEVLSDPRRLFFQTATPIRRFHRVDPRAIDHACSMYVSCAMIFAYSGLSFRIAERMLEVAGDLMRDEDVRDVFTYRTMRFTFDYLRGHWNEAAIIDDDLVEQALRRGLVWDVTLYVGLEMDRRLRRGDWSGAEVMRRKLAEIRDVYGYEYANSNHNGMVAISLVERRDLADALPLIERHRQYSLGRGEAAIALMTLGLDAKVRILTGDREGAAGVLREAEALVRREGVVSPWHQSIHQVAQLSFDVNSIEALAAAGARVPARLRRDASRHARRALSTAAKVAKERVETYRLVGRLWWALGRPRRARRWWSRCLHEGERMGARPELARTYLEVGTRLGPEQLEGLDGPAYVERARSLFAELELPSELAGVDGAGDAAAPPAVA